MGTGSGLDHPDGARTERWQAPGLRSCHVEGEISTLRRHLGREYFSLLGKEVSSSLVAHHVRKRPEYEAEKRHGTPRRQHDKPEVKKAKGTPISNHNT